MGRCDGPVARARFRWPLQVMLLPLPPVQLRRKQFSSSRQTNPNTLASIAARDVGRIHTLCIDLIFNGLPGYKQPYISIASSMYTMPMMSSGLQACLQRSSQSSFDTEDVGILETSCRLSIALMGLTQWVRAIAEGLSGPQQINQFSGEGHTYPFRTKTRHDMQHKEKK